LKVLVIPDKFKGTLTARQAAEAIARGWGGARLSDDLRLLPMSDGGDGFGEVVSELAGAREQHMQTVDAARRPCRAAWWHDPKTGTAIVESARVIGLAMLPAGRFHPFDLDTFGLESVMREAARRASKCIVGIGGSATNDGGFGLALALGWRFLDRMGAEITRWTDLERLDHVTPPRRRRWFRKLTVAVDVQNRLLGPHGASRVYGPQKGLRSGDFAPAEACLGRLAKVIRREYGIDFAALPGSGAAGGLGFGLAAFLGGDLQPGFGLFAKLARLDSCLDWADLVLTGEGCIDRSTLMGKGVGQIARLCRMRSLPCIALGGAIATETKRSRSFTLVRSLTELTSDTAARRHAFSWLERLARDTARQTTLDKPAT
jgi:glycerate kinase